MSRGVRTVLVILLTSIVAATRIANAQPAPSSLATAAGNLSVAFIDAPQLRFIVLPVSDPARVLAVDSTTTLTSGLASAVQIHSRPDRRITIVDGAELERARLAQGLGLPLGRATAVVAGRAVRATYIIVGAVLPAPGARARLDLELIEVGTGSIVRTTDVLLETTGEQGAPGVPLSTRAALQSPSTWTTRRVLVTSGFAAAGAAAVVAWSRDREVGNLREQILDLPPGASDEWARYLAEAQDLAKERDFWWGAAAAIGTVTTVYLLVSKPAQQISPTPPWTLGVSVGPSKLALRLGF